MQILNAEPIVYDLLPLYLLITAPCFVVALTFALSIVMDWANAEQRKQKIIIFIVMVAITATGTVFAFVYPKIDTGKNRYEVIFDDDQSIQDVYDKYIVVKQRGKIWVLEDKERTSDE